LISKIRNKPVRSRLAVGLAMTGVIAMPFVANAQKYEVDLKNSGAAVAIEQAQPGYPRSSVRKGQEGWVRMSFVVTADGRAIDPIIIDSSGGAGFEREAREAVTTWHFETTASGAELPYNVADIRSKIRRGRNSASHTFLRHYRQVAKYLYFEDNDLARNQIDSAYNFGGWNLYESTMLWLMLGRVEGVEGNHAGKLEMYRRALGVSTSKSLPRNDRRDLLEKIFRLESRFDQYAAAMRTFTLLKEMPDSDGAVRRLAESAAEIAAEMKNSDPVSANATIASPCNCDDGQPLWHYLPARRTFSFANLNGNVERFEARCESQRLSDDVEEGKLWTLAPEWGLCRIFVFGDDGARFDFLEHLSDDNEGKSAGQTAVAASNYPDD
jgi:TonB family protein